MKTNRLVPTGCYLRTDGRFLSRTQVTAAVQKYARRHGYSASTVRTVTTLFRAAMNA